MVVAPVDDPPHLVSTNIMLGAQTEASSGIEDTPYVFTGSLLRSRSAIEEPDLLDDSPNEHAIYTFRVATTPAGSLRRGAEQIVAGSVITATDDLVWTPPLNTNGVQTICQVSLVDEAAEDAPPVPMQVWLTPVDDAPTLRWVMPGGAPSMDSQGASTDPKTVVVNHTVVLSGLHRTEGGFTRILVDEYHALNDRWEIDFSDPDVETGQVANDQFQQLQIVVGVTSGIMTGDLLSLRLGQGLSEEQSEGKRHITWQDGNAEPVRLGTWGGPKWVESSDDTLVIPLGGLAQLAAERRSAAIRAVLTAVAFSNVLGAGDGSERVFQVQIQSTDQGTQTGGIGMARHLSLQNVSSPPVLVATAPVSAVPGTQLHVVGIALSEDDQAVGAVLRISDDQYQRGVLSDEQVRFRVRALPAVGRLVLCDPKHPDAAVVLQAAVRNQDGSLQDTPDSTCTLRQALDGWLRYQVSSTTLRSDAFTLDVFETIGTPSPTSAAVQVSVAIDIARIEAPVIVGDPPFTAGDALLVRLVHPLGPVQRVRLRLLRDGQHLPEVAVTTEASGLVVLSTPLTQLMAGLPACTFAIEVTSDADTPQVLSCWSCMVVGTTVPGGAQ